MGGNQGNRIAIRLKVNTDKSEQVHKKKEEKQGSQIMPVAVIALNKKSIIYAYQTGVDS